KQRRSAQRRRRKAKLIRLVKDELSKDHPSSSGLVDAHRKNLDDFRRFIVEHDLIALPPAETLIVRCRPSSGVLRQPNILGPVFFRATG
ncbi:MAG TPA: hypothetical protein VHP35_16345, partial [Terriglobia bacterium]|nr:hypothetical protein [Terriglobia bacterium]